MATHYDIAMGNDIARNAHCEITLVGSDVDRNNNCDVTMSNEFEMYVWARCDQQYQRQH